MDGIKQKSRRNRQKRRVRKHKRSMLGISFVIVLMMTVVAVNSVSLRAKEKDYQAQMAELQTQIDEEKDRTKEIDQLEKYVGTDEYVEEIAKDKLRMVHENEIIFKPE